VRIECVHITSCYDAGLAQLDAFLIARFVVVMDRGNVC
jgi:hypothetical protein